MRRIRRILVAVKDPQAASQPAVEKAARLARAFGARLELFHSISNPLYVETLSVANCSLVELETDWVDRFDRQLERLAKRIARRGLQVSTYTRWDYPAYEAILRRAAQIKAGLIVADCHVGKHRMPSLLRLTDWELLRLSPIPVLLVKGSGSYRQGNVLAAVDPMHAFAKPSRLDHEILQAGAAFQAALGGELHAVHAYVPIPANIAPSDYLQANLAQRLDHEVKDTARRELQRLMSAARVPQAHCHLVGEHPIDAIPETARKTRSAIVVMGAISRSGIKRFFIGNTAEQLLDKLPCDLLIVKPARFKGRVPRASRGARLAASAPFA